MDRKPPFRSARPAHRGPAKHFKRHAPPKPVQPPPLPPGLPARELAVFLIAAVLRRGRSLDDALNDAATRDLWAGLEPRDRALARLIATTVLRRHGRLDAVLKGFLGKPLPERQGELWPLLLAGAAQLLLLDTPPHAAVGLAVDQCRRDANARRFDKLVNAILRRVDREGREALAQLEAGREDLPSWIWTRWESIYGPDLARRIATASLTEADLDLSVQSDANGWAVKLGGTVLSTGSVRLKAGGRIEDLPGYGDGAWWVQDAAAALPVKLLGSVAGKNVADLCAAPGGKTAELAAAGANVTSVEQSARRMGRLKANLERLKLTAELVEADATAWNPGRTFEAVLVDAPCTATGTIRRHPDILHLKREGDIAALAAIQQRLLDHAATLVAPEGLLVYCTCSLEPEEGEQRIAAFLMAHPEFTRVPVTAAEIGGASEWITGEGDLRTLPFHTPAPATPQTEQSPGMDGFFASRLKRSS